LPNIEYANKLTDKRLEAGCDQSNSLFASVLFDSCVVEISLLFKRNLIRDVNALPLEYDFWILSPGNSDLFYCLFVSLLAVRYSVNWFRDRQLRRKEICKQTQIRPVKLTVC